MVRKGGIPAAVAALLVFWAHGEAVVPRTVVFFSDSSITLYADLFLPDAGGKHPAIIALPEGGFRRNDRVCFLEHGRYFSRRGIAFMSVDYRSVQNGGAWPVALKDCIEALRWLSKHADSLNIDTARIAALGASAGGYLASMLGVLPGLPGDVGGGHCVGATPPAHLRAVVSVLGFYDWEHTAWSGGGFIEPSQRKIASPQQYCKHATAAFLLFSGSRDKLFGTMQAKCFTECLRNARLQAETIILPRQAHAGICDFSAPLMQKVLPYIEQFFHRHLATAQSGIIAEYL